MGEEQSRKRLVVAKKNRSSADLPDETVILNEDKGGGYYGLSGVGARVWKLIQHPQTIEEVVDTLIREYDVDRQRCRQDVEELLEDMAANGLVDFQNETAG
jgi:hypothetical protein